MQIKKYLLSFLLLTAIMAPVAVLAQGGATPGYPKLSGDLTTIIDKVFSVVWIGFGALSALLFVSAAVLFLAAQGEPGKVATARQAFLWGVVGIVVAILAFSITGIIQTQFMGSVTQ